MTDTWRCRLCGEVIGVYEPLVTVRDGRVHESSRAREAVELPAREGERYHRACYGRLEESESSA